MWNLMATSIFAYAAGIADIPRPTVSADITSISGWVNKSIDVELTVFAEDTAGVNATVAAKKYKVSTNPLEPAYSAADRAWADIPENGKVSIDIGGKQYLHWYVVNSKGVSSQGMFGPYMAGTLVCLDAPEITDIELEDVVYTLSLAEASNVSAIEVTFTVDGSLVSGKSVEALAGFKAYGNVQWTPLMVGNLWQGNITLTTDTAFFGEADVAKFVFNPLKEGISTMNLVSVKIANFDDDSQMMLGAVVNIVKGAASTDVKKVVKYSKFDLNKDQVVDLLDLAIVLLYVGFDKNHPDWEGPNYKVVDVHRTPIFAKICDVAPLDVPDGKVDMSDVLEVYINYT
jgi:hypothetical protein